MENKKLSDLFDLENQPLPNNLAEVSEWIKERETAQKISSAVDNVSAMVGLNLGDARIEPLGENVAGQQDMRISSSAGMSLDVDFSKNATAEAISHVLLHESGHLRQAKIGDMRVLDWRIEEAINELWTCSQNGNSPMAYIEEIVSFRARLRALDIGERDALSLYNNGKIRELNQKLGLRPQVVNDKNGGGGEMAA